ncbi:Fc.00g000180.m01.CDS01 [Cosmosporella sp. VM-42]
MANPVSFEQFYNIVGGEKRGVADKTYYGIDPSTGRTLWEVPVATQKDLDDAVAAANSAFGGWAKIQHSERRRLLNLFADGLEMYKEQLTELLFRESGKPPGFAESEILMGINTVRGNAEWSVPDEVLKDDKDVKIVIQHPPIGVVAGIVPWNYPFQLAILKIAPALMTGCTIIVKPSPFTPYTALKIGEIAAQTFPPGIVQVLGGDDNLGPWITKHPGISKISFTGSTATGKKVMAAASETMKRVNLELGGNDAAVVTEDFDIAKAAQLVATASLAHSGQICMATKRVYVHQSVYDNFMGHLKTIVSTLKTGEGFCSPIQNKMQYDKVKSIYADCEENKYEFAVGNGRVPELQAGSGYFVSPAIIADPPENSRIVQEEPFGPIIPVLAFCDDAELIHRVNSTDTGLGATVYCRNERRAWNIASELETGSVWVNGGLKLHPEALFGAHKQSGIGGELGPLGLRYYTNTRTVTYWKAEESETDGSGGLFA